MHIKETFMEVDDNHIAVLQFLCRILTTESRPKKHDTIRSMERRVKFKENMIPGRDTTRLIRDPSDERFTSGATS